MEISRLIVPLYPGLFNALGLLLADYWHDYIAAIASPSVLYAQTIYWRATSNSKDRACAEMTAEGVDPSALRFEQQVDLKYGCQMYKMTLPLPDTADSSNLVVELAERFTKAHNQAYRYYCEDPIELMNVRLRALASAASFTFANLANHYSAESSQPVVLSLAVPHAQEGDREGERQAFFGSAHGLLTTPLRSRFALTDPEQGPIIIEEPDTTVVVPPNWTVQHDRFGNLVLTRA